MKLWSVETTEEADVRIEADRIVINECGALAMAGENGLWTAIFAAGHWLQVREVDPQEEEKGTES